MASEKVHLHAIPTASAALAPNDTHGAPPMTIEDPNDIRRLLENNKRFAAEVSAADPGFFQRLAEQQNPPYLLIGCSDSRIPPDAVTKTQPGEIFIHRNVANLVVATDLNMLAVLQYAVEVLQVKHVIVFGHYGCGGIRTAMRNTANGLIDQWLCNVKDTIRLHETELNALEEDQRFRRLVELSVQEQVRSLYKTSIIQKAWRERNGPQVHGWVYDLSTGLIKDLDFEVQQMWKDMYRTYAMYEGIHPPGLQAGDFQSPPGMDFGAGGH